MSHNDVFPVPREWAAKAWANAARYHAMYRRSVDDPEGFWGEQGKRLDWMKPYTKVKDVSFASDDLHIRWFEDGTLNACHNCVDRHLKTRGDCDESCGKSPRATTTILAMYRRLRTHALFRIWLTIAWGTDKAAAESNGLTYL